MIMVGVVAASPDQRYRLLCPNRYGTPDGRPRRWFNPCVRARGFFCLLRKSAVSLGQIHPSRPYRGAGFIPCSGADRRF